METKRIRVQVFKHVAHEGLGSLLVFFQTANSDISYTTFYAQGVAPDVNTYDVLVILGGPMGVYDEALFPWLIDEKRAIHAALDANKPILAICLGAQLVAEILGAKVTKNGHREIGWWPVERLPGAHASWAAQCFPMRFSTFHWHSDTFAMPNGALPLFRSRGCAHQGFAYKDNVVALQFHPEITLEVAQEWVSKGGSDLIPGPYVQLTSEISGRFEDYQHNNAWIAETCQKLLALAKGQ